MGRKQVVIKKGRTCKSRLSSKTRRHLLRHCEPERKVINMFATQTFDKVVSRGRTKSKFDQTSRNFVSEGFEKPEFFETLHAKFVGEAWEENKLS